MVRAIHKHKIPMKYLFNLEIQMYCISTDSGVHEHVHRLQTTILHAHQIK